MIPQFKYSGGTPGADSSTYSVFNTVTAFPGARALQLAGIARITLAMTHSHDLTIKAYQSQNRGTTWDQIFEEAVTAPAATANTVRDFLTESYHDFKIEFVNGGSAQTTFYVDVSGHTSHSPAT
jgi:hypothetical protein